MGSAIHEPAFLDFGNAPEIFAAGLQEVELHGSTVRFILYAERIKDGQRIRVDRLNLVMPLDCVAAAIALTIRRLGANILLPDIARRFLGKDKNGDGDDRLIG